MFAHKNHPSAMDVRGRSKSSLRFLWQVTSNLLAKWTEICNTVFTSYFSVAMGFIFKEPSPIVLGNV